MPYLLARADIVSPLFYSYPFFDSSQALTLFTNVLQESDRAWDSLRRIPYSTPGRWVQALDLSRVSCTTPAERLAVDIHLTHLFPLFPFLSRLILNKTVKMSRRSMSSLASREGISFLRVLKGVKWEGPAPHYVTKEDPLLSLIRACEGLEELEIFGPGLQDEEDHGAISHLSTPPSTPLLPLSLPNLHSLMILSIPKSPLLESLIRAYLPSLRHLMVTPYDNVQSALTTALVIEHGHKLHTLAFQTPKMWPPARYATSTELLHVSPCLQALSLTLPLPPLSMPNQAHPLRIISLPRPDLTYLWRLEAWLFIGLLPQLEEIHIREVKWIRSGLSSRAAEAGVQGEMKEWQRRLDRWKVRVLDNLGRENAS
ncbi:hypothetical protein BU17DRAFT_92891 [Hysterangium stoloniferum]|nr:hypothetical protein BU17DRAFT_92891 [Hysterangium stoloniferum]